MRIIFLDVDGVLNHSSTKEFFGPYIGIDTFNLACLAVLLYIVFVKKLNNNVIEGN